MDAVHYNVLIESRRWVCPKIKYTMVSYYISIYYTYIYIMYVCNVMYCSVV